MKFASLLCLLVGLGVGNVLAADTSTREIDRDVWSVVSRTVVESDIEGMAAVYHGDAVLVFGNRTVPAVDQLAKWGRDMQEAERAGTSATVSFRFTQRQDDEKTAFEAGMFKYTTTEPSGARTSYHVPFEVLLVNKDGKWLIVMERQLEAADEAAWAALE